jgi:hypothetical protein
MSAIVPAVVFEMHMARSRLIDAYNAADLALRERMRAMRLAEKQLISQNIEAIAKVAVGPQYSKNAKKRADEQLQALRGLQQIRCDVVHSRMQILHVEGSPHALFSNVQNQARIGRQGLLLTLAELEQCEAALNAVAREFRRTDFNQQPASAPTNTAKTTVTASSPPPPSPGAAAGP